MRRVALVVLGALVAACGGANPGAKGPGADRRDLAAMVVGAMREEASGDPARATELWLRALDAAVAAPDNPWQLATEEAVAAVKRLQGGESWDSVAKSLGVAAPAPKFVSRSDQTVPAEIRQGVFDEPKPAGKPLYSSAPLPDGDAAVIALSAVREEPAGGDSKIQEEMFKRQLAQQAAAAEAREYAVAARADAKVSENLQALD